MLRFPKNKVVYITLESTEDSSVMVSVNENKREAPDMTVATVYSSQGEDSPEKKFVGSNHDLQSDAGESVDNTV
jgi:hypothetical protein